MPVNSSRNANGQTFNTWLEHSEHLATIREVSGRYGLDCQALEMKQAEQWTLRLLGVVSDMDKQTFDSNGEQFDYMDRLPSLNNIDFTKQLPDNKAKAGTNRNSNAARNPASPKRKSGPTWSQSRAANTTDNTIIQQPRVTIPSSNISMQRYDQHSGQSPFSASTSLALSPSSTYSVATPMSIASPQTPWLQHDQDQPMAFLAPDPIPQSFPPSNFGSGIQYSVPFQQHGDAGFGSHYQYPSYMDQQQMDYILDTRSNLNFVDNKHSSAFKYPNSNNHNTYTVDNSRMGGGKAVEPGVGNIASPKGQMQWVNTYFENYPYTDAGTNANTNMQVDVNNSALHSNVGGNAMYNQSMPMPMPMRLPTISMASTTSVGSHDVHNYWGRVGV